MDLTNEFTVPVPVDRAWEVLNDVELIAPCLPGAQLQEIEGDEYRGIVKVKVGPITAQYKGAATFQEQDRDARRLVLKAEGRDTRGQGSASAIITATMEESGSGDSVSTHVVVNSDVTIKGKVAQFGRGMIADVSAKLLDQFVECLEGKLEAAPSSETPGDTAAEEAKAQATAADAARTNPDTGETVESPGDPATEAAKAAATASDAERTNPDTGEKVASPGDPATEAAKAAANGGTGGVRKIEAPEAAPVDLLDTAGAPVVKRLAPLAAVVFVLIVLGRRRAKRRS